MINFLITIIFFLLTVFIHVQYFKFAGGIKKSFPHYSLVFWAGLVVLAGVFSFLIRTALISPDYILASMVLYFLFSVIYTLLFTSPYLEDLSPSTKIVFFIKRKKKVKEKELFSLFSDRELVLKRLGNLTQGKLIKYIGGKYYLLPKGKRLAGLIRFYRYLLAFEKGG